MRSKYLTIIGFIVVILLLFFVPNTDAATLRSTEVELTPPIGGDLLPGGDVFNPDTNIKESIIFSNIIPFAIRWTINFAMAAAVIALIVGGYQFITAFGNTEQHDKARQTITYAIIGLVLAITAFGIVAIISNIQFT